jgi:putative ABC transport system permease protein
MNSEAERDNADWGNTSTYNYFLLRKGADPKTTSEKASAVFIKNFSPILKSAFDSSWEDFVKAGNYARVELFPLRDIHLHSDLEDELGTNGDIKHVYIFGIIGLFILALACINFMNLATARAAIRAREVGVRKAVGAMRTDLAKQFLSESVLMSLAALGLALAAVWLLLPMFNQLSGKELTISIFITPGFWLAALALAVLIGVAAGSYPAFFLSAFQPGRVLKGGATASSFSGAGNRNLRSALVVFQFSTTSVLLIGSLVVYQQLEFIRNKKLGFNRENVFILNNAYQLGGQLNSFKEKVLQSPAVQRATYCNSLPALSLSNSNVVYKGRQATQENSVLANNWWADHDYLKTLDMAIVAGRDFSKTLASDSTAVIVNETFAKSFGYPQKSALDGEISLTIDDEGNLETRHIVGVVKDFNFSSLRNTIEPLAIYQSQRAGYLAVRFQTEKVDVLVKNMRSAWDEMAPGKPFDYAFLDQRFDKLYATESRMEKIVKVFACLAIFIACIGLFGLSTFMTEQRRKEIGIRKVLGASVAGITALLAKDFLKLVLIAIVIASPVAYWFMQKWLADFAYRIDLQWWIFAVAGAMAVAVAFLTVSFQSVRAALANPVKSLRSE